ncbi:hypothetical protein [Actinomadura chokoriensis]|uniref:XRE family transcriptional regulator n=1 Tax=Actinomadura chokoriensis TaxID=454156 RepID=A0ABV4R7W5_9ACTN
MARRLLEADGLEQGNVINLARQIYDWERGKHFPRNWADTYAKVFKIDPSELFSTGQAREASSRHDPAHDFEDDDMKRRALLSLFATTAVAAPFGHEAERLRAALTGTLTTEATTRDADAWARTAFDHAHEIDRVPPAELLPDLLADFAELNLHITRAHGHVRSRLVDTAAQLAALTAYELTVVGDPRGARRWWRTAAQAADESGNQDTSSNVRGKAAVLSLYTGVPELAAVEAAEETIALSSRPSSGLASAHSAQAQAFAQLGRLDEAKQALNDLTRVFQGLPAAVTKDKTSAWGWSEQRLHHVASYVHTHAGDLDRAQAAQDSATALYPADSFLARAQIELHRAGGLIRIGDTDTGAGHVVDVMTAIPSAHRGDSMIRRTAFTSLNLASTKDARRPALRDAYAMLANTPA